MPTYKEDMPDCKGSKDPVAVVWPDPYSPEKDGVCGMKHPLDKDSGKSAWVIFVTGVFLQLEELYTNLLNYRITLTDDIKVYRGVYIEGLVSGSPSFDYKNFTGFTSTTYDIDRTFSILEDMARGSDCPFGLILDNWVVLEIDVPKGTQVFSTNLCGFLEEEIIFTENAELINCEETTYMQTSLSGLWERSKEIYLEKAKEDGNMESLLKSLRRPPLNISGADKKKCLGEYAGPMNIVPPNTHITVTMIKGTYRKISGLELKCENFKECYNKAINAGPPV
jgi:hypothetical protein